MRKPEYLSPSSMQLFFDDRETWYIRYMSDHKPPREPQTAPMSVGSGFDAYVKSYLHGVIYGDRRDPAFELASIFEKQVEPQNRDFAWEAGKQCFNYYKASGALSDLMLELSNASSDPHFEIEVKDKVSHETICAEGITLLGKPDAYFRNKLNHIVILDWKVNGWCAKTTTSPKRGYKRLRDGDGIDQIGKQHKEFTPIEFQGMIVNSQLYLEDVEETWAAQLATYGWLCGAKVGEEFITCIDQIVAKPATPYPLVRIAEHRTRVSSDFQIGTFKKYKLVQAVIDSGYIFTDLSREDSLGRCQILDAKAELICKCIKDGKNYWDSFQEILGGGKKVWS